MQLRSALSLILLPLCAALSIGTASAETLRLGHTAATSHAHHEAAQLFAKNVADRTGGRVKIEIYPAGELGDQPALAEQVTLSALDMGIISLGNLAMYSRKLNAMTAPFLFSDYDHAHRVIDKFVMPWMNEGLAAHDAVGLSMFDYGFRQTTTQDIVVNSADDLKGVKIRVPPATGLLAAFDSIGANTQKIAYSELYTSLKQGVVQGEENPVFTILADSLFETQNQLAMTNHYFDCQVLLINKMVFETLDPETQKILQEEAVNAQNLTRERISKGEAAVVEELKAKGMNVTYPDRASFTTKMQPAYAKIGELAGKAEMEKLLKAIDAEKAK
ncbi:TRAP transporter substrate-binding protein [Sutterella sp.]|uniref:TRAP transporter substrate-binding protein n=1 Tax=Sutterella sp. TaxID=1981025 RepID=UPI0026E069F1|nr:TRAP transporter substrate-binding protein [Sutterella sp.]MDO5532019.1 TRAP transporter substrate-binding protein [Sutterella sp.]